MTASTAESAPQQAGDESTPSPRGPLLRHDPPQDAPILWLLLTALLTGALLLPLEAAIVDRRLALLATLLLLATTLIARTLVPAHRRRLRATLDAAGLIAHSTLFGFAAAEPGGAILTLYLLPLVGVAISFGRTPTLLAASLLGVLLLLQLNRAGTLSLTDVASYGRPLLLLLPIVAGALLVASLSRHILGAQRRINDLSAMDALTGLLNARAFEQVLAREHRRAERQGHPYSLIVIDIDGLKQLNESEGYGAGNELLHAVAQSLARSIRASDVAARLGGDEFVVLLCEADPRVASVISQRMRHNIYGSTVSIGKRIIRANIGLGCASFPMDLPDSKGVLNLALRRLQQEKALRLGA